MKKNIVFSVCVVLLISVVMVACSSASATSVKSVTFAQSLNEQFQAVNPTTQFYSTDTINVSVDLTGRPTSGTLTGKYFYGTQLISEATLDFSKADQNLMYTIGNDTYVGFHLVPSQPWPVNSDYHFELSLNGKKVGDYPFAVIQ